MARATTANYEQLIIEIETTPGSGTFTTICGMTDATVTRTSNMDETEVPDCDDESLPNAIELSVRSQQVGISGTGVWSLEAHKQIQDWWYNGTTVLTRVRNAKVEQDGQSGDPTIEEGPAYLTSTGQERTKGQKVTGSMEIMFDGLPTRTTKV